MSTFKKENGLNTIGTNRKTLHKNLEFTALEQYKLLRTNMRFTLTEDAKCPVIGITSSMRGEGKSTTAINLSYVLAESGSRVVLIDGDLRIPSVAKKMGIRSKQGLSDMLLDKDVDIEKFASGEMNNWYIVPSGEIPPNPSELLGSSRMGNLIEKLKEQFDYIVIDLPPVDLVSDALAISNFLSGMIVIVRQDYAEKKELNHCIKQLELSEVNILGFVMTHAGGRRSTYSKNKYYKKSYGYYKHYTDKDEADKP